MKTKVLFVCVGNTCRSPMAEYIARAKFGDVFESTSAGLRPQTNEDARSSIETLWDVFKIDAASHQPQDVRSLAIEHLDLVVAMDTSVADGLTTLGAPYPGIIQWNIHDPFGGDLAVYHRCAWSIYREVERLARNLSHMRKAI